MKIKKLHFSIFIACFSLYASQAQQSVHNSGGNATGAGGNVSYSVGQTVYTTATGTTGSTAAGVQQAYEVLLGAALTQINLEFTVFPNPTTSFLNLSFGDYDITGVSYALFDSNGKQIIATTAIQNTETTIDVTQLNTAVYVLQVLKDNKPVKIYKIVKK